MQAARIDRCAHRGRVDSHLHPRALKGPRQRVQDHRYHGAPLPLHAMSSAPRPLRALLQCISRWNLPLLVSLLVSPRLSSPTASTQILPY